MSLILLNQQFGVTLEWSLLAVSSDGYIIVMNEYKILNIIGQGAFGNAYLARHISSNQDYVIKKIELTNKNKEQIQNIYHEVKLLEEFKHVNIVSYKESIQEGDVLNIVMEFCSGGDINQLVSEQKQMGKKIQQKKILDWAAQIALAIFYMHDKRILHRDLKTPNIFILDNQVKLGDFGISKVLDQKQDLASTSIGTPYYMSPEQYRHKPYSYKSDIWAFGCILYQMCNQKRPFQALSLQGLAVKVMDARFSPVSEFYSKQLRELIHKSLQKREKQRPSILDVLQLPIIRKKVVIYLKETYNRLLKENKNEILIDGILYQAEKLGISLGVEKKAIEMQKKSTKPEFSAEKKRQEKERIRQQLEEELKLMSEKTKQSQQELKKMKAERNKKKVSEKSSLVNRKSSQSIKIKEQQVKYQPLVVQKFEQKPRKFKLEEEVSMYEPEFEDYYDSQDECNQQIIKQAIPELEEEEDKESRVEARPYSKQKYSKPISKETKGCQKEIKQTKEEAFGFRQLGSFDEEALKESIRNNMERVNTIKHQISAIDFSISSSEDELQKTIDKPEQLPKMKKKQKNPVHVMLSDKINDLEQMLNPIQPKLILNELIAIARSKGSGAGRNDLKDILGSKQGAYHLVLELVKLKNMSETIPHFI